MADDLNLKLRVPTDKISTDLIDKTAKVENLAVESLKTVIDGGSLKVEPGMFGDGRLDSMVRFNQGKLPLSLVPPSYGDYCAAGLQYGAIKYAPHNWRRGGEWSKVIDSLQRHLNAFRDGEDLDEESGLPHLALAGCNLAFLTEFYDKRLGTDDRFQYPDQAPGTRRTGRVLEFREPPRRQQAAPGPGPDGSDASGSDGGAG